VGLRAPSRDDALAIRLDDLENVERTRVDIVTARGEISREVTERFLATNEIPYEDLVMEADVKTGYDVLVDDAPHNVLQAADTGSLALLMDQPYNRDLDANDNPYRVHHWDHVATLVPAETSRAGVPA
jgi:uncharacterized HAD superfamily protein